MLAVTFMAWWLGYLLHTIRLFKHVACSLRCKNGGMSVICHTFNTLNNNYLCHCCYCPQMRQHLHNHTFKSALCMFRRKFSKFNQWLWPKLQHFHLLQESQSNLIYRSKFPLQHEMLVHYLNGYGNRPEPWCIKPFTADFRLQTQSFSHQVLKVNRDVNVTA
jgi:hypothetical protein